MTTIPDDRYPFTINVTQATGSQQVLFGGDWNYGLEYPEHHDYWWNQLDGGCAWANPGTTGTYRELRQVVSTPGTLSNLVVKLAGNTPTGSGYDFTINVNGNDYLLVQCRDNTVKSNTTDTVSVVPGDVVCIKAVPVNTPGVNYARWTLLFESQNSNESLILGNILAHPNYLNPSYNHIQGGLYWWSPDGSMCQVMPTSGKIKNLHIALDTAMETGKSLQFTLMANGQPTALTCTITGGGTVAYDTTHQITLAIGDTVSLRCTPTGYTAQTIPLGGWGMTFVSDVEGESLLLGQFAANGGNSPLNQTLVEHNFPHGTIPDWLTTTGYVRYCLPTYIGKFSVLLSAAPSPGSYTFDILKNGVASGLTLTLSGTNTWATDQTTFVPFDTVPYTTAMIQSTPSSSPAALFARWSMVRYNPRQTIPEQYENLLAYTLVPGTWLSVNPQTRINFTALPQNPTPYPYLQSPLLLLTDFQMKCHMHISDFQDALAEDPGGRNLWGGYATTLFSRDANAISYINVQCPVTGQHGNGLGIGLRSLWVYHDTPVSLPKHIFSIYNWDNAICPNMPAGGEYSEFIFWQGTPNTSTPVDIYMNLVKSGTTATYWLYSDANMTTLLNDYNNIPFPSAGKTVSNISTLPYLYFLPVASRASTSTDRTITGYFENFHFQ